MAGAEGDYWTQVIAGGSQEVVGEVRLMACSKQRRKPNDAGAEIHGQVRPDP
jgi:hypothetical protein